MEILLFIGVIALAVAVYNIGKDKLNEKERLAANKAELIRSQQDEKTSLARHKENLSAKEKAKIEREVAMIRSLTEKADNEIKKTITKGNKKIRTWYGSLYAEVESLLDDYKAKYLRYKKHPSKKGAEVVKEVKKEKRELNKQLKILEYELKTYEQYFPIIEDFKDYILEDDSFLINDEGEVSQDDKDYDPAQKYLSPEEYKKLSTDVKNQKALQRYMERKHSKLEIGRFYERYVGYLYELDGWVVKFFGIIEGFDDLGRDLICTKGNQVHIVQTKNWSRFKIIREKYLYQHFATTTHYELQNKTKKKKIKVVPVFYSTIDYSDMAKQVAKALKIEIKTVKLQKNYPMIKCNVNPRTKEKIYHLPFDQQYDKIIIGNTPGEFYVKTVKEAVKKGFRRAFKYRGPA